MKYIKLGIVGQIALWLTIIGAINWGLTGLGFNLVAALTGSADWLERGIYIVVGLAGITLAVSALMGERTAVRTAHP